MLAKKIMLKLRAVQNPHNFTRALSSKTRRQSAKKFSGKPFLTEANTSINRPQWAYSEWEQKINIARDSLIIVGVVVGIVAAFATSIDIFVTKPLEKHMDIESKDFKITLKEMKSDSDKKFSYMDKKISDMDIKLDTIIRLQNSWWKF